jgi:hypothetical protein
MLPVSAILPSALKAAPQTGPSCDRGLPIGLPVSASHSRACGEVEKRSAVPLSLESDDHLTAIHSRLDDLQRDLPLDGGLLLGEEHDRHASLADLLQKLIRTHLRSRARRARLLNRRIHSGRWRIQDEALLPMVFGEQLIHPAAQRVVSAARLIQVDVELRGCLLLQGLDEDVAFLHKFAARRCGEPPKISASFSTRSRKEFRGSALRAGTAEESTTRRRPFHGGATPGRTTR